MRKNKQRGHVTGSHPAVDAPDEIVALPDPRLGQGPERRLKIRRFQPQQIRIGFPGGSTESFSDLAAREIAIALLKRIAKDPFTRAVLAAGWTSSPDCPEDSPACIHLACCVCDEKTSYDDSEADHIPTHLCRGPKS